MTGTQELLLEVKGLTASLETDTGTIRPVNDVTLSVRAGETLAVVGESGSGKSMLAFSLMRLLPPSGRFERGSILWKGRNLLELSNEQIRRVRGKEIALSQIARGADVIFHAAGTTGLGVFEAAKERGVYAIGVDSNQNGVVPGTVLTSMVKRVDVAIERTIEEAQAGRFQPGLREFGLAEDGVGFAVDEHNRELLTPAMLERAAALRDSIVAGAIQVPSSTGRR